MRIPIRKLNEKGIEIFQDFLLEAKNGSIEPVPKDIINSGYLSEIYYPDLFIESKMFNLKNELAQYIFDTINQKTEIQFNNPGLWTWLSAFFFDTICPVVKGQRNVKEEAKYILTIDNWKSYYRHLIATPVRLYAELGDLSTFYLFNPPYQFGELEEQFLSRQEIATNKGIIEAAIVLYWDEEKKNIKRGARNKTGPGIIRRFTKDIIPQFQMTYDLNSMSGEEILILLPSEFNIWQGL